MVNDFNLKNEKKEEERQKVYDDKHNFFRSYTSLMHTKLNKSKASCYIRFCPIIRKWQIEAAVALEKSWNPDQFFKY